MKRTFLKLLLPILIISVAFGLVVLLVKSRPETEPVEPPRPRPLVRVVSAEPETVQLKVRTQGVVEAKFETTLRAEVSGRVLEIHPDFRVGAKVERGTVLVQLDDADYRAEVAARQADLASAQLMLDEETARGEQAAQDWARMGRESAPGALTLRKPQLAQAEAALDSAQANLEQAQRRLDRTRIQAPYPSYIAAREVSPGDLVGGTSGAVTLGRIFSAEGAEVRLPVSLREAGWLTLPQKDGERGAPVRFSANVFGQPREWQGQLVRVEAELEATSRLVYLLAELDASFQTDAQDDAAPLLRGLFVDAEITGRELEGAYRLPRIALRDTDAVYIVDEEDRLMRRPVEIAQRTAEYVIITGGIEPGERVCVSAVAFFVDGMGVTVEEAP